jgi:hypothetical protein
MLSGTMRCSFCGRSDSEVAKLVAGPVRLLAGRVYICDRCAAQTVQIMERHSGGEPGRERQSLFRRILKRLGSDRRPSTLRPSECRATWS